MPALQKTGFHRRSDVSKHRGCYESGSLGAFIVGDGAGSVDGKRQDAGCSKNGMKCRRCRAKIQERNVKTRTLQKAKSAAPSKATALIPGHFDALNKSAGARE